MSLKKTLVSETAEPREADFERTIADQSPLDDPQQVVQGDVVGGKYVVDRIVGVGGMGQVVVARHRELGKLVAIKLLHLSNLDDDETVQRFKREALATAALHGEHIVRVHDVGETDDGVPYMIMDYLEGRDLSSYMRQHGALPIADVVTYGLQACEALAEAHDAGIIHRDIKPGNLFLAATPSKKPSIRVLDFGVAKGRIGTLFGSKLTSNGTILGTPRYMAPEQFEERSEIDERTDIWGLGATLFRLATGEYPFDGEVFTVLALQILDSEPKEARHVRPEVGAALSSVLARCLRKRPSERFANMRELARALEHAAASPASAYGDDEPSTLVAPAPLTVATPTLPPRQVAAMTAHTLLAADAGHLAMRPRTASITDRTARPVVQTMLASNGFFPQPQGHQRGPGATPGVARRASLVAAILAGVLCALIGLGLFAKSRSRREKSTSAGPPAISAVAPALPPVALSSTAASEPAVVASALPEASARAVGSASPQPRASASSTPARARPRASVTSPAASAPARDMYDQL